MDGEVAYAGIEPEPKGLAAAVTFGFDKIPEPVRSAFGLAAATENSARRAMDFTR
jgi:hypothetical protein